LRFAVKAAAILPASPSAVWAKAPAAIPPPASTQPRRRPAEPPRAEQFFFKPGEPVFRVRNSAGEPSPLLSLFHHEGRLSLTSFRTRMAILIGASLVMLAGAAVGAVMCFRPRSSMPVLKFRVAPPEHTAYPGSPSVSPDGRHLVFSLQGAEGLRLL